MHQSITDESRTFSLFSHPNAYIQSALDNCILRLVSVLSLMPYMYYSSPNRYHNMCLHLYEERNILYDGRERASLGIHKKTRGFTKEFRLNLCGWHVRDASTPRL